MNKSKVYVFGQFKAHYKAAAKVTNNLVALACFCSALWATPAVAEPKVSIIIDDLGYDIQAGARTIELNGPIACAVLPHTPYSRSLATYARHHGKEVLLHLPLEAMGRHGHQPGQLNSSMSRAEMLTLLEHNIAALPHIDGINNHQGSRLTQMERPMSWLMHSIAQYGGLFFVDSVTTGRSIALEHAQAAAIPAVQRDIFLDSKRSYRAINQQFNQLIRRARTQGWAVAIGHPYPQTLKVLEQRLPELAANGIRLVSVREVIYEQNRLGALNINRQNSSQDN